MEHDVVAQARRAVDADQDAVLDGSAEAHRQAVRPRARPLVIGPRVRDQSASFAEDVRGARCGKTERRQFNTSSVSVKNQENITRNFSFPRGWLEKIIW